VKEDGVWRSSTFPQSECGFKPVRYFAGSSRIASGLEATLALCFGRDAEYEVEARGQFAGARSGQG
jgi:hypothetical protein